MGAARRKAACAGACILTLLGPTAARAGPPFVTDDPEPTDRGHWEIYNFVSATHLPAAETDGAGGFDLNYGAAKDLQLTATLPLAFRRTRTTRLGLGEVELAAKYRFIHQGEERWAPDLAVFPRLFLPTAGRSFGSGRPSLLLPVWLEKDFGPWSVFGGGGYSLNGGRDSRSAWQTGLAVSRTLTPRLTMGMEITHQTPDAVDGRAFTAVDLGVIWRLTPHWSLLASGGPGIQNAASEGDYTFYASLKADY